MNRTCDVGGCGRKHVARGFCRTHYKRWRKHGDPTALVRVVSSIQRDSCDVEGCKAPHAAHGFCAVHNARWKRTGSPLGKGPLPLREVVRLRRMVGLPDGGPTPEMRAAWVAKEGVAA